MRNLPKRKNIRLKEYDYKSDGYYFVTICAHNKKPNIELYKHEIEQILMSLPGKFAGLAIDWYVLMPTHIHIIFIFNGIRANLSEVVRIFKAMVSKGIKQKFWQKGYYDHIIRNETALFKIREYIENNPSVENIKFEEFYRVESGIANNGANAGSIN